MIYFLIQVWITIKHFEICCKLQAFIYLNINNLVIMSFINGDSLLSNISNVSVLIKPGSGSSVFNLSMGQHHYQGDQSERLCEVKLQDIFPDVDHMPDNSLLGLSLKKEEREGSGIQLCQPILPRFSYNPTFNEKSWMISQQKGFSEDQRSPEEQQQIEDPSDKKVKNQTKNIPKNYGKAIISFIQKYRTVIADVCQHTGVPFQDFYNEMVETKKTINTIADLRRLWIDYKYARCMRIVSNLFLRKYSLAYIFNSRICNFRSHIKYRHRLCEAITNPNCFKHIKDY